MDDQIQSGDYRAIVAIPACNEADRIGACLAALATQRDVSGAPLPPCSLAILVYANNCSDDTVATVRAARAVVPFAIEIVAATLPPLQSHAGGARKAAMDRAADLLDRHGRSAGAILTTDADTRVCSTWVARTLAALDDGVDAVAGYVEADPAELLALGRGFLKRSRLEDQYLAQIAEVQALCDPVPHDPWPNHRVGSGASLAITLAAYRAIGGLPARAVGEDAALVEALTVAGFAVRHDLEVVAVTSCRLDGRAQGGAADTMRARHLDLDASCDADMRPFRLVRQRALWKGALRTRFAQGRVETSAWNRRLRFPAGMLSSWVSEHATFEGFWRLIEDRSPALGATEPLRPSGLPAEISAAATGIARLRRSRAFDHARRSGAERRLAPILVDVDADGSPRVREGRPVPFPTVLPATAQGLSELHSRHQDRRVVRPDRFD